MRVHSLGVGVTAVSASQMRRMGPKEVKQQATLLLKGLPPTTVPSERSLREMQNCLLMAKIKRKKEIAYFLCELW